MKLIFITLLRKYVTLYIILQLKLTVYLNEYQLVGILLWQSNISWLKQFSLLECKLFHLDDRIKFGRSN
jgi:hypothetical protein